MDVRAIVAIIRPDKLDAVQQRLREIGVRGLSVSKVKGYGEYRNFFAPNWIVGAVRIEIFARGDEVEAVSAAIADAACTGLPGDGLIAVLPVEKLSLVRTHADGQPPR